MYMIERFATISYKCSLLRYGNMFFVRCFAGVGFAAWQSSRRGSMGKTIEGLRGKASKYLALTAFLPEMFQDFISKLLVVDTDKRLTAEQAKDHPWLLASAESLEVRDLGENLQTFKVFNAKTKLRAAMKTVRLFNLIGVLFVPSFPLRSCRKKGVRVRVIWYCMI